MQKFGLIVDDNGSDMYISGTFDVRWDNGVLNPAFRTLTASDFEVVQLGWKPAQATLSGVSAKPSAVDGGQSATGTVTLSAPAPSGGATVTLTSASAFSVPASVEVPQGASSASFTITTQPVWTAASGTLTARYAGTSRTTVFTVNPRLVTMAVCRIEEPAAAMFAARAAESARAKPRQLRRPARQARVR